MLNFAPETTNWRIGIHLSLNNKYQKQGTLTLFTTVIRIEAMQ